MPSKVYNIRIPAPLAAEVDRRAEAEGIPPSTALRVLAEAGLSPDAQQRLCEAKEAARPTWIRKRSPKCTSVAT